MAVPLGKYCREDCTLESPESHASGKSTRNRETPRIAPTRTPIDTQTVCCLPSASDADIYGLLPELHNSSCIPYRAATRRPHRSPHREARMLPSTHVRQTEREGSRQQSE